MVARILFAALAGAWAVSVQALPVSLEASTPFHDIRPEGPYGWDKDFDRAPIVGILTTPWNGTEFDKQSGFLDHYVRWLEQGGARIVPIKYNLPDAELDRMFDQVNALFYTGGELSLRPTTPYYNAANRLYKRAIEANRKGDYFPIWGTCMGMQLMSIMGADDYAVLSHRAYKTDAVSLPLEFNLKELPRSRMFEHVPREVIHALATRPLTSNLHHDGVDPEDWAKYDSLNEMYRVVTNNHDPNTGKAFISTIEGRELPFYGVQWHPERPQFDWKEGESINHGVAAVRAMYYFAEFFVSEARKSKHRFSSNEEEERSLIFNFTPTRFRNTSLLYLFDD